MLEDAYIIALICAKPQHSAMMIESLWLSGVTTMTFMFKDSLRLPLSLFEAIAKTIPHSTIYQPIEGKDSRNESYHNAFALMLSHACLNDTEWYVLIEDDVIFNPSWFDKCMEAYKLAVDDGYNVGMVSPLDWDFDWYGIKANGAQYKMQDWFTTHCAIIHRDVLLRGIDFSRPFWHEYDSEIDKYIGLMLVEKGYVQITTRPSHAYSLDGLPYAQSSFTPETEEIKKLCSGLNTLLKVKKHV